VPSLALSYSGGGFGGGPNAFFGNFNTRGDLAASLFWDLRGLGVIDRAQVGRRTAEQRMADLELVRTQARVAADVVAACELRAAAAGQMKAARESVTEALESLELNLTSLRRGAGLPGATRPLEVLQPIQALAQSRMEYLSAVLAYNRAQFRLYHAVGRCPKPEAGTVPPHGVERPRPGGGLGPSGTVRYDGLRDQPRRSGS
jgi:outer membrane protein TolC